MATNTEPVLDVGESFNPRSKILAWVCTINNYDQALFDEVINWCRIFCHYYVMGKEVGETTGTPHLQGFFTLKLGLRLSELKKVPCFRTGHFEMARADGKKCSDYCKKGKQPKAEWTELGSSGPNFGLEADFVEGGTLRNLKRGVEKIHADYGEAVNLAKQGKFDEIEPALLVKHYSNLKRIQQDSPPVLATLPQRNAEWIYGVPHAGKSTLARTQNPDHYVKTAGDKWWDGYKGQRVVIIEDVDESVRPLMWRYKLWLDTFPFLAESKGTSQWIRPDKVVITSNHSPRTVFGTGVDADAIIDRIGDRVTVLTERWRPPDVELVSNEVMTQEHVIEPGNVVVESLVFPPDMEEINLDNYFE